MALLRIFSLVIALCLCACSVTTIAPAEQLQKSLSTPPPEQPVAKSGRDVVKKQAIDQYRCANKNLVRVQRTTNKKNATITVTFSGVSHKLSPTLSDKGKKYSNIRWIWQEAANGQGTLRDNRGKMLAERCVKK